MKINVSLQNTEFKDRKIFILDIIDDITCWKITKRYSQILELHENFKNIYSLSIEFPKKKFFGSMNKETVIKRASEFNKYFDSILQIDKIKKSSYLSLFIRTDIYLEHFGELRDAYDIKSIVSSINKLKNTIKYSEESNSKLLHELNEYIKRCDKIKNDLSHFYDRLDIIDRNSLTIVNTKTVANIDRKNALEQIDNINNSINEIFDFIDEMINKKNYPTDMHKLDNSISNISIMIKSIDNMILDINDTRITDAINSNKYRTLIEKLSIFKLSIDEFNQCAKGII